MTASVGSLGVSVSCALTDVSATVSRGTLAASISVSLRRAEHRLVWDGNHVSTSTIAPDRRRQ